MSGTASLRDAGPPLGLLLLLVVAIRVVPDLVRPTAPPDDCEHAAQADLATMERCAAQRVDDVELLLALGRRLEDAGNAERAAQTYRQAIRVDPRDGGAHMRLGEVLLARGDRAAAGVEARAALAIQPNNPSARELARRAEDPAK